VLLADFIERSTIRGVIGFVVIAVITYFAYSRERRVRRLLRKRPYQYALVVYAYGNLTKAVRYLCEHGLAEKKADANLRLILRTLGIGSTGLGPYGKGIVTVSSLRSCKPDAAGSLVPSQPRQPVHPCGQALYQPDSVLQHRVASVQDMGEYLQAVSGAVEEFAGFFQFAGQALSLTGVVRPGRHRRFWLEFQPDGVPSKMKQRLLQRLEVIEAPQVDGPVAFVSHLLLWGGPDQEAPFSFVPRAWLRPIGVLPDDPLKKLWRN
jgi:hypothetical protein